MERSQKENLVGELQGIFNSATAAVLIDYRGLAANELVEMRQEPVSYTHLTLPTNREV